MFFTCLSVSHTLTMLVEYIWKLTDCQCKLPLNHCRKFHKVSNVGRVFRKKFVDGDVAKKFRFPDFSLSFGPIELLNFIVKDSVKYRCAL